jgi:hypothetical protein
VAKLARKTLFQKQNIKQKNWGHGSTALACYAQGPGFNFSTKKRKKQKMGHLATYLQVQRESSSLRPLSLGHQCHSCRLSLYDLIKGPSLDTTHGGLDFNI